MVHAHPRALGNYGSGIRSRSSILQEDVRGLQSFFSSFKLSVSCGYGALELVCEHWEIQGVDESELGGDSVVFATPLGRFRRLVGIEVRVLRWELSFDLSKVLV